MTTPGRSNGLQAQGWAALTTVDPRLVPDLLHALGQQGIAARSEPARASRGPYLEVRVPALPQEQVYVDATQVQAARTTLDQITGQDTENAFQAIVAGWEDPVPQVDWPGEAPAQPTPQATAVWRGSQRPLDPESMDEALDSVRDPAEDDAHYVAPPPPPVPRPSWQAALAVLMLLGGIAVLVWASAVDTPDLIWRLLGVVLISGGVVGLVLRLHDAREAPEDPYDDGARV